MYEVRTLTIKCPKCGVVENLELDKSEHDFGATGLLRVGYIHKGHVFLLNVDPHFFVRGAYIVSYGAVGSDVLLYFHGYRVLGGFIVGIKTEFISLFRRANIFDVRAYPSSSAMLYEILEAIEKFLGQFAGAKLPKFTGLHGRRYRIVSCKDIVIFSPCRPQESKYKADWLGIICNILAKSEPLDVHALSKIVSYVDENIDRAPTDEDREKLMDLAYGGAGVRV